MSKESRFENRQMDEAYVDYERALHQAKVVCDKIDEDEPNRAASHLRKALNDLSSRSRTSRRRTWGNPIRARSTP